MAKHRLGGFMLLGGRVLLGGLVLLGGFVLLGVVNVAHAQSFPPGYVDPEPLLAAVAEEIGEANLRCITYSGEGYNGAVGQTFENAVGVDWPRPDAMPAEGIAFEADLFDTHEPPRPAQLPAMRSLYN